MPFSEIFSGAAVRAALEKAERATPSDVRAAIATGAPSMAQAAALFSTAGTAMLEEIAQRAHRLTIERFGNTVALYAPLYLSNDCVCTCTYCGFSMGLDIRRKTLRIDEVIRDARVLAGRGFRNVLLVSSEHPRFVNAGYLSQCIREVKRVAQYVAIEVAAAQTAEYDAFVDAGCDGVVLYQESYDPDVYARHHLGGPKKKYGWRLDAPERAASAGVRHLGIGALFGLGDWRFEALSLIEHARHLRKYAWRSQVNISFPRINSAAGGFVPAQPVTDAQLAHLICAVRIALPGAGITLSTRETAALRDSLVPLGITHMSAGSSTEPGGYSSPGSAGEQFHLEDRRAPEEVAARLKDMGYDPVFKDWENMKSGLTPEEVRAALS